MFTAKKIEIDASSNFYALLHEEDAVMLGIKSGERVEVFDSRNHDKKLICELVILDCDVHCDVKLKPGEIGLFEHAFFKLGVKELHEVGALPAPKPKSLDLVKKKFEGGRLTDSDMLLILHDIINNNYSEIETTFFVLACTAHPMNDAEVIALTRAMVTVGKQLDFKDKKNQIVVDKHCIGGVPGNRTTMIVIPIVAAAGLTIPKTSSRSITSPSGTADTMEVLCNVSLTLSEMYKIVKKTGGCIAWGGSLELSPADDIIINVEHPLEIDSEGQMIASVLSKKKSAGSTHVLIDIPVGKNAKVKTFFHGYKLKRRMEKVGHALGMKVKVILTDGSEPIGNGIGPALEAEDVLKVLNNDEGQSIKLRMKAIKMAGIVLEMGGLCKRGSGHEMAAGLLASGAAAKKFEEIRKAQGKKELPPKAKHILEFKAKKSGKVCAIDIKKVTRLAYILGAPKTPTAGLVVHKRLGEHVNAGESLFSMHAESELKSKYGAAYARKNEIYDIR